MSPLSHANTCRVLQSELRALTLLLINDPHLAGGLDGFRFMSARHVLRQPEQQGFKPRRIPFNSYRGSSGAV